MEVTLHAGDVLIGLYPLEADTAGGGDQFKVSQLMRLLVGIDLRKIVMLQLQILQRTD